MTKGTRVEAFLRVLPAGRRHRSSRSAWPAAESQAPRACPERTRARDGRASSRPGRLGARWLIAYRPPRLIADVPAPLPHMADCSRPASQSASFLVMQPGEAAAERTFIETARRAQIVAAAIDTIAELGYAQASFARIADRVGISRGLISYHL